MVISMRRNAMDNLIKWKHSEDRKPMVLKGARQVGKTWLMKEFGRQHYKNFVYFNFDESPEDPGVAGSDCGTADSAGRYPDHL